jgi:CheY-like chemotaxis protein
MPTTREQALVLVASTDSALVDRVTETVRSTGAATCRASSAAGCLRVATAVGPDVVLLDARFPPKLERLLRAHPATAGSDIVRLQEHVAQQRRMACPDLGRLHWAVGLVLSSPLAAPRPPTAARNRPG